jgi:DNA-binding transcriptional LysR family regulator
MELRHLKYFVAVAEELHFTRAAKRLAIAQPPLSQQIQQLERELGVQLLDRNHQRVRLTEAGAVVLAEARVVLSAADQILPRARQVALGERGSLGIGFVTTAMYGHLPSVLKKYRTQFPHVELDPQDLEPAAQMQALLENKIQVGFVRGIEPHGGEQATLVFEHIEREPFMIAMSEQHALAKKKRVSLAKLAGDSFSKS